MGDDEDHRQILDRSGDPGGEVELELPGVLKILENQHEGGLLRSPSYQAEPRLQEPLAIVRLLAGGGGRFA